MLTLVSSLRRTARRKEVFPIPQDSAASRRESVTPGLMALVKVIRQRRGAGTEAHAAFLGGGEYQLGNKDVQRVAVPRGRELGKAGYDLSGKAAQLLALAAAGGYRGLQSVLF